MRYFLHLAYHGSRYRGWQRQSGSRSIQETIEEALSNICKTPCRIHGCGRTDAEVHASQYFAHFDLDIDLGFDLVERLNYVLPPDIAVYGVIPVADNANAQKDACSRTYHYYLHTQKIASIHQSSAYYAIHDLDIDAMQRAVRIIAGTSDFRSLCKSPDLYDHTRCTIQHMSLDVVGHQRYVLRVSANRFLRSMMRYMVARLLDIGKGTLGVTHFEDVLSNQQKFVFPHMNKAHPQGLYLTRVQYPYLNIAPIDIHIHNTQMVTE